ncbi:XRE family transcriptional regulator [Coleofasciculus chthonoplastes]|uniref:XRE family transcriptional regulator n=1 Tax=Coleofasciculus chthonoplastes TaxID=64178 RepID=UPI0032FC734B
MSNLQRQDIIEQFCILYEITSHNGSPWFKPSLQPRLKRHMEKLVQLHPEWHTDDYVDYFWSIINQESLPESEQQFAHLHLVAYLDVSRCHFIRQFARKFPFPLATCLHFFDLTTDVLYNRDHLKKIIHGHNANTSNAANLKTYCEGALKNIILEQINWESDWHLLCNVDLTSRRKFKNAAQKLREALFRQGITEPMVSQYCFAWQYFVPIYKNNRLYHPSQRKGRAWVQPEQTDFEEAARDYNLNRFLADAPLQVSSGSNVTAKTIQQWMNTCIQALRNSQKLVELSRDADSYEKHYDQSVNPWETLNSDQDSAEFINQITPNLQAQFQRIDQNLDKIRSKIPRQFRQAVMPLCYPHELSLLVQAQFAKKVGVNQGTVARYIANTYKSPLLTQMDSLIRTQLDNDLDVWSQNYVKEFLSKRFTNPYQNQEIDRALMVTIESLGSHLQLLLKLRYGQKYSIDTIVDYLENESSDTIEKKLNLIRHDLEIAAIETLNQLKISYIEQLIKNHYKQVISDQLVTAFSEIKSRKIMKMRYAHRMPEEKIARFLHKENVIQAINQAKQQLQQALLQWSYGTYGISLDPEKDQISQAVETWLNQLYCLDLNELHSGE